MGDPLWRHQETLAKEQLAGIRRYLDRRLEEVVAERPDRWQRVLTSPEAYLASVEENRARLRRLIGLVDERSAVEMEQFGTEANPALVAETERYSIHQVRWTVFANIQGEGLLLTPKTPARGRVVALPDADQTPEQLVGLAPGIAAESQFARRLAESGLQVLVPVLINRESTFSGGDRLVPNRVWQDAAWVSMWTNIPHREWAFRQAYLMGRHVIGYEVQKVLAAVDWFEAQGTEPIGVAGYGEGGLLAFYAGAVDPRIDAVWVSGYFGPREALWTEPVYRSIWGFLTEFGDAEIASLIVPRPLVIEYSAGPVVEESAPPDRWKGRAATRGSLKNPPFAAVQAEVDRLQTFFRGGAVQPAVQLINDAAGAVPFGSARALNAFVQHMKAGLLVAGGAAPMERRRALDVQARQKRQIDGIIEHTRALVRMADRERYAFIKGDRSSPGAWDASMTSFRDHFWNEVIGRLPEPSLPPNARLRQLFDQPTWTGYEVILGVWPEMFSFGVLGVPKNLADGERRPAVVLQHGERGLPLTPIAVKSYHGLMNELTERGFVTYSPHNAYELWIQQAMPLKGSRFSVILAQHQQILRWLGSLPYVDASRIGFYGKSWGGQSALYIPALLDGYAVSICSAFFNDWTRKVTSTEHRASTMFHNAISIWEFGLGEKFGHAEMAGLIAPRPFMVEYGYDDGIAQEAWVGYEFAKVRRLYDELGIGDRAELELFRGGHEINGQGTYEFLHRHLNWRKP